MTKQPKLKVDFTHAKVPELIIGAEAVLGPWINHPAIQEPRPSFLPTPDQLKQAIDELRRTYNAALKRDQDQIKLRDRAAEALKVHLYAIAHFYETGAVTDPRFLINTGFEELPPPTSSSNAMLEAPSILSLKHGQFPGVIIAKASRTHGAGSYEMHIAEGDPTVESNWKYQGVHMHCSAMEMKDLEGGKVYSFRVRAIGPKGAGPWSPPGTLRAL
jgi:hypothetical protein